MNRLIYKAIIFFNFIFIVTGAQAQLPPIFPANIAAKVRNEEVVRKYISPSRIVWKSDSTRKFVQNAEALLVPNIGQAILGAGKFFTLKSTDEIRPAIILDFGIEIQGGLEIVTTTNNSQKMGRLRIRYGESVSETMSNVGEKGGTNDHALRDIVLNLPWIGRIETGNTGFRFVRIELMDPMTTIEIKEINAIFSYRDIPYLGSFKCNDEKLNKIWMTGAYTVHLNMQNYLWDGIKRDRLVWLGDMHPEVMTVNTVFGYNNVVPKTLDHARDITPLPKLMNGISSYSMWWIIIHRDWYKYQGNLNYLKEQKPYLDDLLQLLMTKIDSTGKEDLKGFRFLDWPSSENKEAINAGLQSLMVMTFNAGSELCTILGDKKMAKKCDETIEKLKKQIPDANNSKQAAALLSLSGLVPAEKSNDEILSKDGVHRMSTFYGYYMLQARAKAGDYTGALNNIREYWGAMLDMGATTFWEDFDIDWIKNASRIDEMVPEGKKDIHGDFGNYCYKGFRHSFCHGWASGPTPWLSQFVLGIQVVEPGCKTIKLEPHLGDLEWAEGSFPTPYGVLTVSHKKMPNGRISTTFKAPKGVKIIQ